MKTKIPHLILAGLFGTTIASQAAVIAWGDSTSVSTASDISTAGTLVEAINLTADSISGTVDVNGVTFTNDGSLLSNNSILDKYSGTTGDSNYDAILSSFDVGSQTSIILGGSNLEFGKDYEIQLFWAYDAWDHGYGDGEGNTVLLAGPAYVIGTFTADATTQNLSLGTPNPDGWGQSHLNAYQIRSVVPEPSSFALIGGLLALGHVMVRRRR